MFSSSLYKYTMAGRKRKGSVKQEDSKKQQKQDGQKAISHDIDVPIDEGFQQDGRNRV